MNCKYRQSENVIKYGKYKNDSNTVWRENRMIKTVFSISGYLVSGIAGALIWEWTQTNQHGPLLLIVGIILAIYGACVITIIRRWLPIDENYK